MKQVAIEAKIKEQKRRHEEATKWRHATDEGLGDLDLKEAMEKMTDDAEKTTSTAASTATVTTMTMTTVSTSRVVTAEVYSKPYTNSAEQRGEQSTARSERRENLERELQKQRQKEEEEQLVKEKEADDQRKVVERALLQEEEQKQQEKLQQLHDHEERKKQKEQEDKEKKKKEKEARKRKYIEEEEAAFIDDEENDPDFDPDKEDVEPGDLTIEGEDEGNTFQVEKHSHILIFSEAGEFIVWVHSEIEELERAVQRGKDMETHTHWLCWS